MIYPHVAKLVSTVNGDEAMSVRCEVALGLAQRLDVDLQDPDVVGTSLAALSKELRSVLVDIAAASGQREDLIASIFDEAPAR